MASAIARHRFSALSEIDFDAEDGLDKDYLVGILAFLRATDAQRLQIASFREFQTGFERAGWDGSVDEVDAALMKFPQLTGVYVDVLRHLDDEDDLAGVEQDDGSDELVEHYLPSVILDRIHDDTFFTRVCHRFGKHEVLNIVDATPE